MSELPDWPMKHFYTHMSSAPQEDRLANYERARADAAIARLRLAADLLRNIEQRHVIITWGIHETDYSEMAREALAQIGPIPE